MKKLLPVAFFLAPLLCVAQTFNGPESAEYDALNNRWLISNYTSKQVLSYSPSSGSLSVFCTLANAAYGIEILDSVLYCCDANRVKGFNLFTGAQVFNVNLGGTFLNGITSDGVNTLFVTDYGQKKIYRVNVASQTSNVMATIIKTPNGIYYDGANNRLVYVTWGTNAPIQALSLADSTFATIKNTTLSNLDGITRDSYGNWYVTAWGDSSLRKFDANFTANPVKVMAGLDKPADIDLNAAGDSIAIPNSGGMNNVVFYAVTCAPPTATTDVTAPLCNGDNATATLSLSNGTAPYSIAWSNGATADTLETVAGDYSVTVTDLYNCPFVTNVSIAEPAALDLVLTSTAATQPSPNCNGTVVTNPTGGTAPYTYTWSDPNLSLTNACPGSYDVTITDANGCSSTSSVVVDFINGIDNVYASRVSVYPNPAHALVTITLANPVANGTVELVDMFGRALVTQQIDGVVATLERSNFASGLYQVVVRERDGRVVASRKICFE